MFTECTSLVSISLPDSMTIIPPQMFSSCTSLTTVKLPANLVSIENGAFFNCEALNLTVPDGVRIDENAFGSFEFEEEEEVVA